MKRIISVILLLSVLFLTACGTQEQVDMTALREQILLAEETVADLFTNDFDDEILGYVVWEDDPYSGEVEIIKYQGPNNRFSEVCEKLDGICTNRGAEILIRRDGFVSMDGQIGLICADGEVTFPEFGEDDMEILSMEDGVLRVKITRYTVGREFSGEYTYTFLIEENGTFLLDGIEETGEFQTTRTEEIVLMKDYQP